MFCLLLLLCINVAFASDNITDKVMESNDNGVLDSVNIESSDTLSVKNINHTLGLSGGDVLNDGESSTGNFTELNEKILSADDELVLNKNYTFASGESIITISKPIVIDGNGFTINGNNLNGVFIIDANDVVLKNIHFINTKSAYSVRWNGDNGQLLDSTFYNVQSGSVYWQGDNAFVNDIKITNSNSGHFYSYSPNIRFFNSKIDSVTVGERAPLIFYNGNFRVVNSSFSNSKSTSTNGWRAGGIYYERAIGSIEYCNFTKCSSSRSGGAITNGDGFANVYNCRFIQNSGYLGGAFHTNYPNNFYNCYFNGNTRSSSGGSALTLYAGSIVEGCVFENQKQSNVPAIRVLEAGVQIRDSHFLDGAYAIELTSSDATIDNCEFINNNAGTQAVIYVKGNKCTVSNSYFENNVGTLAGAIKVNSNLYFNNVSNTDINNKFANGTLNLIVNDGLGNFTAYMDVHVTMADDPRTFSNGIVVHTFADAVANLAYGGTIHVYTGVYNDVTTKFNVPGSVVGEEDNIFINVGSFRITSINSVVENLIFNDTANSFDYTYYVTIRYCLFTNARCTAGLFSNGDRSLGFKLSHCDFIDCDMKSKHFIGSTRGASGYGDTIGFVLEYLYFNNCINIVDIVNMGASYNLIVRNITIENSQLTAFTQTPGSYATISNITLIHNTIGKCFSNTGVTGLKLDNIYLDNNLMGTGSIFYTSDGSNVVFNDIKVVNTNSNYHVFSLTPTNYRISNVYLNNVNMGGFINSVNTKSLYIDNFVANHCSAKNGFINIGTGSVLSKINFNDVSFSEGSVCILYNSVSLSDSSFSNYVGHIQLHGDNIKLTNVTFEKGNYSGNGGAFELVSGNDLFVDNCKFIRNNATNGGAIYINNVTNSSYILNLIFTANTASNLGGAVYVEPSVYYFISDSTRKTFNTTFRFNDLYDADTFKFMEEVWVMNEGNGNGSFDNPTNLKDAFNMVSPYGRIIFKFANETVILSDSVSIKKFNINILGNNTTVSRFNMIVSEYAYAVNFYNFTFCNYTDSRVFDWHGDDGSVINCTFKDNGGYDVGNGSAIAVYGDNFNIVNSSFINNFAGFLDSIGGAVYCNGSGLVIDNCDFEGNIVYNAGAHLYLTKDANALRIYNSNFTGGDSNNGNHKGSGVYILSSNYIIRDCVFDVNHGLLGGALYLGGEGRVISSGFYNNSAVNGSAVYIGSSGVSIRDSYFADPKYDENNNVIPGYVYSALTVTLINNTLSFTDLNKTVSETNNNLDLEYNYKYFEDYDVPFQSGVSIDESLNVNGHSYRLDGSGLARVFKVSADNVSLSNMTFVDANVIGGNGGAVLWSGSDGSISDSFFSNCSAVNVGSDWNYGGAVCVSGANMNITDCTFDTCVSNAGSALRINNGNSVITNCIFTNNNADQYDGAIWYDGTNSGNFVLSDCIFRGNNASRWGGALRVDSKGSINNCIFENNAVVYSNKTSSGVGNGYGGAIYLTGNGVSITNSTFKGNHVDNLTNMCGGGIYASKVFTLSNCYFMNNSASNGSAIYYVSNSDLNIDSCTFANPRFDQENNWLAGYIYSTRVINFNNVSLSFTDLNHTIANSGDSLDLLFNYMFFNEFDQKFVNGVPISKDFTINGNSFILDGNHSARIFNVTSGNVELSNLTFTNGNATLGGAIYVIGNITVLNSNFTNNSAVLGGAIFIESGYSNLTNCTFNNNAAANGSAIYIITSVNHWDNLDFTNNIASTNATIYFRDDSTVYNENLTFTNNVIPNGLHIVGENHIYAPIIYVNATKQGFGIVMSEPTSLSRAADNILDNGVIIICSDYTLETIIRMNNLTNVTVTGNHSLRRDKHLFILPNTIQYNTVIQ